MDAVLVNKLPGPEVQFPNDAVVKRAESPQEFFGIIVVGNLTPLTS